MTFQGPIFLTARDLRWPYCGQYCLRGDAGNMENRSTCIISDQEDFISDQNLLECRLKGNYTVLVKSFAHLNSTFFLASPENRGKLWKVSPFPSGGSEEPLEIKCAKLLTSTVQGSSVLHVPSITAQFLLASIKGSSVVTLDRCLTDRRLNRCYQVHYLPALLSYAVDKETKMIDEI